VEPKKTTRERVSKFIKDLVSDWQPSRDQVLWTIRIVFVFVVLLSILTLVGLPFDITLWNWLSLLIVPVVLALGGYLFTRSETRRTQDIAEEQRNLDRELADEHRQDDMLQAYLDGMAKLITDKEPPLHTARPGDNLSVGARARTLTVLPRLGRRRKGSVLQFLYDSGLIAKDGVVLDLKGADLSLADLFRANLRNANLIGANLSKAALIAANLSGADLHDANLRFAVLVSADLQDVNLSWADLSKADLQDANLIGADLSKAMLIGGTDLSGTDLSRADLTHAKLWSADLENAKLIGADLSEADLHDARLSGADLKDANLSGADLQGSPLAGSRTPIVTKEQLAACRSLEGATMPNGQKYEDWLKSRGHTEDG
jgi:hypothetical protein